MVALEYILSLGILFLFQTSSAAPSISGNLDSLSLLAIGGNLSLRDLNARDGPDLEIRGVVGGRKKRFVISRQNNGNNGNQNDMCCTNMAKSDCTKNKPQGYLQRSDCSCQVCPKGKKPNPNKTGCEDDKDVCPAGQKKNEATGKCETIDPKKGKCPNGQVLDEALGGQTANTENPSCVPDDRSKCKAGEIPETRASGDMDTNKQVKCGKEPVDKKKCDPSTQYVATEIMDNFDGTFSATQSCKRTKRYSDAKTEKMKEVQPKKKAVWDSPEGQQQRQRKKDDAAREEERIKKGEMEREEQRRRPRKKSRMGYCLPLAAFMEAGMSSLGLKRSIDDVAFFNATLALAKRDDATINDDDMHEWSTEYFDEDFVQSEEIADSWPADAVFNWDIGTIDANEWVRIYVQKQEEHGKRDLVDGEQQLEGRDGIA
ncbi:hypothetical protein EJ04DRAFT_557174 [Polyplosphaeria fusca]|uniref:Uncharacterized protein n=1 Tax=Polyplosphaeria fusca TaxID=682080 RepID=A0A9P4QMY9_9PLEO|nr:hypothetical protein EJ04DRAFT_557174 [Polyplosphaeria fusca]